MSLFDQQILVRHPVEADQEHDGWGPPKHQWQEKTVRGWYETRSSSRDLSAGDQITSGYWLYLEGDQKFTDQSQALINGEWHIVDGRAQAQPGGKILSSYKPIALKYTSG